MSGRQPNSNRPQSSQQNNTRLNNQQNNQQHTSNTTVNVNSKPSSYTSLASQPAHSTVSQNVQKIIDNNKSQQQQQSNTNDHTNANTNNITKPLTAQQQVNRPGTATSSTSKSSQPQYRTKPSNNIQKVYTTTNNNNTPTTQQPQSVNVPQTGDFGTPVDDTTWKQSLNLPPRDDRITTDDVKTSKGIEFEDFHLSRDLLKGIFEMGYEHPSPIQEESIPVALLGKHILARAKNGTGKTASYSIPVLERIDVKLNYTQAIVLVPTRELALQTSSVLKKLSKHLHVNIIVTTGGTDLKDDIIRLQSPCHIIVATPGRLLDLANRHVAVLDRVSMFVMDEGDKLLSPEFIPLMDRLLGYTSTDRQILCFSATFPSTVADFSSRWMSDAHQINLMEELTLKGVTQYYAFVDEKQKLHCLSTLFSKLHINQCIIFCNSVQRVELLAKKVTDFGSSCFFIHGRLIIDICTIIIERVVIDCTTIY